jgi:leucyl-tRNA synthetase
VAGGRSAALARREVTVVLQVDGKVRGRLTVEIDAPDEACSAWRSPTTGAPWLQGRAVERVVVVPNRLVNIVTRA